MNGDANRSSQYTLVTTFCFTYTPKRDKGPLCRHCVYIPMVHNWWDTNAALNFMT